MIKRRKIAIFTGNRAEYGLQFPILRSVHADTRLDPYLLVGGAHLEQDFGGTLAEIEKDGFKVYRQVEMQMNQDTLYATAQAIGTGILSMSRILDELRPDWLVIYADRYESFAAMVAGTQMGIPTAHIEGGDYTEGGALDDTVRHAMTKLAHLHFTTNKQASDRVKRMGEEKWRVYNVGQPALDMVSSGAFAKPDEVISKFKLNPNRPIVLFCQHSVATESDEATNQILPSIDALNKLTREGVQVVITYPNNDAGGRRIIAEILKYFEGSASKSNGANLQIHKSLGRHYFHGLLNFIGKSGKGAFVGNSSALIKETPVFGCPAVNIGTRQQGRLRGNNVIDVPYNSDGIYNAIRHSIDDNSFRNQCLHCHNPYGAGNAGPQIAEVLATIPIDNRLIQKKMTY